MFAYFAMLITVAIFQTPPKSRALERRLTELDEQRRYLAQNLGESAQPWTGALRRLAAAEATVGSTSIEGYGASIEDTVEILAGRPAAKADDETQRIIAAYGQAMDRVAVPRGAHPPQRGPRPLPCHLHADFDPQPPHRPGRLPGRAVGVPHRPGALAPLP